MDINIDKNSGFCFGVVYAVEKAEKLLEKDNKLFCLGDIVHNDMEVKRLNNKGLEIIDYDKLKNLKNQTVLFRAHGEPPETYKLAKENNIKVVDASCPIVLKLQIKIRNTYLKFKDKGGQIVIYGKKGHAEVVALSGHADNQAIIVSSVDDLDKIDYSKPIALFSQTTKSSSSYHQIILGIKKRLKTDNFNYLDSVCKQVSNRDKSLKDFCKDKDIILFMSGKKSSNGKMLYEVCKSVNDNTIFITDTENIDKQWFKEVNSVGITGATSTPFWLMEKAKSIIETF